MRLGNISYFFHYCTSAGLTNNCLLSFRELTYLDLGHPFRTLNSSASISPEYTPTNDADKALVPMGRMEYPLFLNFIMSQLPAFGKNKPNVQHAPVVIRGY